MKSFVKILLKNYKKTAFILGGVSALAFPPVYMLPLFILAMFLAMKITDNIDTYKKTAIFGYCFGISYFISGLYWISNALLVDFITFGWLYPISMLAIGLGFGVFMIPPFMIWHYFQNQNVWIKLVSYSCVWVLLEGTRSVILTGFPWNLLGTVFAFSDIYIQTASIWGTYGLSFIMLIISGCFYAFFNGKKWSGMIVFCLLAMFMTIFGVWRLNNYKTSDSEIKLRLVQPSIPQSMKWNSNELENNLKDYVDISQKTGLETVDFVIWGETALPFDIKWRTEYKEYVKKAVPDNGYLITGVVRFGFSQGNYQPYNSMYIINKDAIVENYYDKNHLVPFGEYIPLREYLPDWIRPLANNMAEFAIGEKFKSIQLKQYPPFGALICYEIIFPDNILNRKNKPKWLVVLTNDGWYGKSSGPYQHLVATQMRAVEEGITIVRSANSGISALISPAGQIIKKIDLHQKGYIDVNLPQISEFSTIYSDIGKNSIFYAMLLILALLFLNKKFLC